MKFEEIILCKNNNIDFNHNGSMMQTINHQIKHIDNQKLLNN